MKLKHYLRGLGLGIIVSTLIVSAGKNGRAAELSNEEIRSRARQLGMIDEDDVLLSEAKSLAKEAAKKDDTKKEDQKNDPKENTSSNEAEKKNTVSSDKPVSTDMIIISSGSAKSSSVNDEGMMAGSFLGAGAGSSDSSLKRTGSEAESDVSKKSTAAENDTPEDEEKEKVVTVAELESRNSDAGRASENEDTVVEAEDDQNATPVQPLTSGADASVTIVKGESSTAVAKKLQNAGVISDASQFDSYLCLNGFDRRLVTGSHTIPKGASARDIAEIITGR